MFLHGVASFRGISTPSLTAQGEQRRSSFFNNDRDIPREQGKENSVEQGEEANSNISCWQRRKPKPPQHWVWINR